MKSSHGRVLIVDDHPRNVSILQKILGGSYSLATAGSGEEALAAAPKFAPDVILLDIMMPGIDGYETCRRLRGIAELAHTKIIMVSARAMASERLAGYEAGADDYIVKPFDEDELLAKVRVYMRLKTMEEVDRLRTELLMLLSHESRTPLGTILGPIDRALANAEIPGEIRKLLVSARNATGRLNDFVERLVFLTGVHAGSVPFDIRPRNLNETAAATLDAAAESAKRAGVELVAGLDQPVDAEFDEEHVRNVLDALLENAIRVSPRAGAVRLSVSADDGWACLAITDDGPGVAEHFRPRILAGLPIRELPAAIGGNGLSLVTARAVIRRHGGILTAESGEAGGAKFMVRLPLAPGRVDGIRAAA